MVLLEIIGAVIVVLILGVGLVRVLNTITFTDPNDKTPPTNKP